ncbi:MAG: VWA domain-containing protein [Myxococcaceae bacterium]
MRWLLPLSLLLCACPRTTSLGDFDAGADAGPTVTTVGLSGRFCTEPTDPGGFPVKIMVLLDQSGSMCLTDPSGSQDGGGTFCQQFGDGGTPARIGALKSLVSNLAEGSELSVITFDTAARKVWPGNRPFATPDQTFGPALDLLPSQLGTASNFQAALELAQELITDDANQVALLAPEELQRTRYVLVMLTDGVPYPRCSSDDTQPNYASSLDPALIWADSSSFCNDPDQVDAGSIPNFVAGGDLNQNYQLHAAVDAINGLKTSLGVADVRFDYTLLFNAQAAQACGALCEDIYGVYPEVAPSQYVSAAGTVARWLGHDLSARTGGVFQEFDDQAIAGVNFQGYDLRSLVSDNVLGALIVQPMTATLQNGAYLTDFDGDGLSDREELVAGSDLLSRDTDGDGFDDLFEATHPLDGFSPVNKDPRGCDPLNPATPGCVVIDADGDGLSQFAEAYLHTSAVLVDSDRDLIPDGLEARFGLDPAVPNPGDTDGDGLGDLSEVAEGTDPLKPDNPSGFAFTLGTQSVPGTHCYTFTINQLPAPETMAGPSRPKGINLYQLWFSQNPARAPSSSVWNAACAAVAPDGKSQPIPETAFDAPYQLVDSSQWPARCVGWLQAGGQGP